MELILDLYGCDSYWLNDPRALEKVLLDTAREAGFEVVSRIAHQFSHQGVTLVLILSQSHLALHTWPEDRFAAVDVYVCGPSERVARSLDRVRDLLIHKFNAKTFSDRVIDRAGDERALPSPLDMKAKSV